MMPPLALYSSASIWAAHFTPSPVIAEGPVIAEEKPTRIGGAVCAPAGGASAASPQASPTAIATPVARYPVRVIALSSLRPQTTICSSLLDWVSRRPPAAVISTASATSIPPHPCSHH